MSEIDYSDFRRIYALGDPIGKGEFGVVKEAWNITDIGQTKRYAFKSSTTLCALNEKPKAMLTEVNLLKQLNHRCIVKLHHYYTREQRVSPT